MAARGLRSASSWVHLSVTWDIPLQILAFNKTSSEGSKEAHGRLDRKSGNAWSSRPFTGWDGNGQWAVLLCVGLH